MLPFSRPGVLGAIVALSLCSAAPVPQEPKPAAVQVEQAYRDYLDALKRQDEKALRRMLAEDFTYTDSSANLLDRDKAVKAALTPGEWVADVKGVKVRVYGESAVVNSHYRMRIKQGGVDCDIPIRSTMTFVKKGTAWLIVAQQDTIVPER